MKKRRLDIAKVRLMAREWEETKGRAWIQIDGWDEGGGGGIMEGVERGYWGNGGLAGGDTNLVLRAKGVAPLTELDFFSWI